MHKTIPVDVQLPTDSSAPAPTLYLLNGVDAGLSDSNWVQRTTALQWLSRKHVNVVQPIGGKASYYTDWRRPDPVLGINKWRTFLTEELPPIIDHRFRTTGANAIAGLSMAGTSVLQLAISKPRLYRSVAAYSGCAEVSDPLGYSFVQLAVGLGGLGGNTDNMYGPYGDPMWAANDPYVHADQLRGVNLFISNGSGLPGPHDTIADSHTLPLVQGGLPDQIIIGGIIEAATNVCAHNMARRLQKLNIPATYDFSPTGTHSWGYWQDALERSWPVLAKGLALPAH
jgi:S-formylglutathione hydrolase FrmB